MPEWPLQFGPYYPWPACSVWTAGGAVAVEWPVLPSSDLPGGGRGKLDRLSVAWWVVVRQAGVAVAWWVMVRQAGVAVACWAGRDF